MTIDQITNELKRRISFIEKNPPKRAEKFSKLAFYRTYLMMAENCSDIASTYGHFGDITKKVIKQIEKEFSK